MKKLVFMFVAVAAISFASCGNKTSQAAPVDTDTVATIDSAVVDSATTDSASTDSAAEAPAEDVAATTEAPAAE